MKSTKAMIYIMIIVLFAGGIYLFATGHDKEGALRGIDPQSYDIVTSCTKVDGNIIVCNGGNDQFLVLNDTKVYKDKVDSFVDEKGYIEVEHSYSESDVNELKSAIEEKGTVVLKLWMMSNGKIDCIMMVDEILENKSETLAQMNGISPDSYSSESIVTGMKNNRITLAPANYSEENKEKLAEFIRTYRIAEDAGFYHVDLVCETVVDEEYEREQIIPRRITYSEYSYKQTKDFLKKKGHAFVWLDENGVVKNIMTIDTVETEKKK